MVDPKIHDSMVAAVVARRALNQWQPMSDCQVLDEALAGLKANGYEIVQTSLLDVLVDTVDDIFHGSSVADAQKASDDLRDYREGQA